LFFRCQRQRFFCPLYARFAGIFSLKAKYYLFDIKLFTVDFRRFFVRSVGLVCFLCSRRWRVFFCPLFVPLCGIIFLIFNVLCSRFCSFSDFSLFLFGGSVSLLFSDFVLLFFGVSFSVFCSFLCCFFLCFSGLFFALPAPPK
jgi:hypothetical protein